MGEPRELFLRKLGAAYTMVKTVLELLEKNEQEAQDSELKQRFMHHHDETLQQVQNLERARSRLWIEAAAMCAVCGDTVTASALDACSAGARRSPQHRERGRRWRRWQRLARGRAGI